MSIFLDLPLGKVMVDNVRKVHPWWQCAVAHIAECLYAGIVLRNVPELVVGIMPANCVWVGYSPGALGTIAPVQCMSCIA